MSEHIIYHIADGIATLTLNRPKVLNAINYDLLKELDELLDQAAADDSLRVLQSFCSRSRHRPAGGNGSGGSGQMGAVRLRDLPQTGMFPDPDAGSSQRLRAGRRM